MECKSGKKGCLIKQKDRSFEPVFYLILDFKDEHQGEGGTLVSVDA
jgi:hypothetical protein